ncbi:MAG: MobA/MobL family protein [Sphaerochaetaceae bacterium]|nr:MobA/MobL family protein [Sphaerochaetaceae bacterium]
MAKESIKLKKPLPDFVPDEYHDRQTLWNAVEKVEKHPEAQLSYSFDITLQNELTEEENLSPAREFLQKHFVNRGMIADFAMHDSDREDGIPNPHFHFLCPIRPMEETGRRGMKQRRVHELDEGGNRIRDADGKEKFNAVPTIDWGRPETPDFRRGQWAVMVSAKFEEKGLACRIDHRTLKAQGLDESPAIHS